METLITDYKDLKHLEHGHRVYRLVITTYLLCFAIGHDTTHGDDLLFSLYENRLHSETLWNLVYDTGINLPARALIKDQDFKAALDAFNNDTTQDARDRERGRIDEILVNANKLKNDASGISNRLRQILHEDTKYSIIHIIPNSL